MNIRYSLLSIRAALSCIFVVASLTLVGATARSATADIIQPLFIDVPGEAAPANDDPTIAASRLVTINSDALEDANLELNLFPNARYTAIRQTYQRSGSTGLWRGPLTVVQAGNALLSIENNQISGQVTAGGRFFVIRPVADSLHMVTEVLQTVDLDELESDLPASFIVNEGGSADGPLPLAPEDTGDPSFDIIVFWTPAAATALAASAKPYTDMEEWINYAMQLANEAYDQSGANIRIRLVHASEVPYVEGGAGFSQYLNDLSGSVGALAVTQTLEEAYNADLVALIVNDPSSCGLATTPISGNSFALPNNHSVNDWNCLWPNYTLTHELGHNMGSFHQQGSSGSTPFNSYAWAFRSPSLTFRTILSQNCTPRCTRVNYLSNPDNMFSGEPMGVAIGDPNEAHNTASINERAATISAYRATVYDVGIGPTFQNSGNSFDEWGDGNGNDNCLADQAGANDIGGLPDVTEHCVASNQVDSLYFMHGLDDTSLSVGTSVATCTLIDTDPDQFFNYALCTTIEDGLAGASQLQSVQLYTCDNSSRTACGGAALSKTFDATHPVSGAWYSDGAFHFDNSETGGFDVDSLVEIQVPYSDMSITNGDLLCIGHASFTDTASLATPLDAIHTPDNYTEYNTGSGVSNVAMCQTSQSIVKSVSPATADVAGSLAYTMTVENTGQVVASAVLTDTFPTTVNAGSCTASITSFSYSTTRTNLGTFPIEQINCTDNLGTTNTTYLDTTDGTAPLTCTFNVGTNALISDYDITATWVSEFNFTFELNVIDVIAPDNTTDAHTGLGGLAGPFPPPITPHTYSAVGDTSLSGRQAQGIWQIVFYDLDANGGLVTHTVTPGLGNSEITLYGYQQQTTVTPITAGDLALGAAHTLAPGEILTYSCPATVDLSACDSQPASLQIDNIANVFALQDSAGVARTSNTATVNVNPASCPSPTSLTTQAATVDSGNTSTAVAVGFAMLLMALTVGVAFVARKRG